MENELFVVWLIKSSERARAAVGQVLGDFVANDMLRRIGMSGQSDIQLGELAARIRAEFTPPRLPAAFTAHHLRMLVDSSVAPKLAQVLGCPQSEVFANLLDPHQLTRALLESGHTQGEIFDAELLLLKLLPRLPRLAVRHGLESGDWGTFIERRGWLVPAAMRKLTAYAARREWPSDARPTQILAGILEGTGARTDFGLSPRLDALAVIELRRRIGLLAEQLRTEAVERADEAAQLAPDLTSVGRLPAWLELYERDAVATGLLRLFTGATSVADMLQGAHPRPLAVSGDPTPDERLRITNESSFGVWRRRVAFDIACLVQGQSDPQVILSCRGLRQDAYDPVREKILQMRGSDLATVGDTLGERLLNTQVAQHHGLRGRLRQAVQTHGAQVIQCVVLTGLRRPITIPSPWHEYLSSTLPYGPPRGGDALLPDVDHVNQSLRADAGGRQIEETR